MENTPYQRLELFWQAKGLRSASAFSDTVPGLSAAALSAMKRRGTKPSSANMRHMQQAYPDLSADYVLHGEGSMYRNDQRLVPAGQLPAPLPSHFEEPQGPRYTAPFMAVEPDLSGLSAEQQADFWRARWEKAARQLAELALEREQQETQQLISSIGGKSFLEASAEAADPTQELTLMVASSNPNYSEAQEEQRRLGFRYGSLS